MGKVKPDRAFIWDAGVLTDLGTLGGYSAAYGINDHGQVVGVSQIILPNSSLATRAFIWRNGVMNDLGVLPGEDHSQAFGVNERGDVVGSSWHVTIPQFLSAEQATLWRDGGAEIIDLGLTPGPQVCVDGFPYYTDNIGRAINNCGQIVGHAQCVASGGARAAFLWQDGVMHNLNDLIPSGSGWELLSALDINDAGQIVGFGLLAPNSQYLRAYLLEPLTPPSCIPGDLDHDGDVDSDDLVLFEQCAAGPTIPLAVGCEDGDLDNDTDGDQSDFALIQRCLSGENNPADPNCADREANPLHRRATYSDPRQEE